MHVEGVLFAISLVSQVKVSVKLLVPAFYPSDYYETSFPNSLHIILSNMFG